ncbi:MAG: DUF2304 domain-containing protein [Clostridia bacterium]|nr:DUF2304 domain-containing protein [Clostridia bacterium]
MASSIARTGMICMGVVLICLSVRLNSTKKILVNHAVIWSLIGITLILVGTVPTFYSWTKLLAPGTAAAFLAVMILAMITEFRNSVMISKLTAQNRELAMRAALLDHECAQGSADSRNVNKS